MKISNRFETQILFQLQENFQFFVCWHEHFILRVWALVNLNWPIKFLQKFISCRVENSFQVKMCSHAISHWFENFTSVSLTEKKHYPKWTQTQSKMKFMWTQIENTPRTEVNSDRFDITLGLMWRYSNMKV